MVRITDLGIAHIDEFGIPALTNATVLVPTGQEFEVADELEATVHSLEVHDMDNGELRVTCWQTMEGILHRTARALS